MTKVEAYLDGVVHEPETPDKIQVDVYRPPLEFEMECQIRQLFTPMVGHIAVKNPFAVLPHQQI